MDYPVFTSAGADRIYAISGEGLHIYSLKNGALQPHWQGMPGVQQALELPGGDLVVLDQRGSRITRLKADEPDRQTSLAEGLDTVTALALGPHDSLFLLQAQKERVMVMNPANGETDLVVEGLDAPLEVRTVTSL